MPLTPTLACPLDLVVAPTASGIGSLPLTVRRPAGFGCPRSLLLVPLRLPQPLTAQLCQHLAVAMV